MTTNSRPMAGAAGDLWDYLAGKDEHAPEYYMGEGRSIGEVWGKGAERLGVTEITKAQFAHLANGRSLNGRDRLIQSNNGKHVPGIDVTFSAPKSVSLAMVTAAPEERERLWDDFVESVKVGFADLEANAPVCRVPVKTPAMATAGGRSTRTQGSATERVPAELIAMIAKHSTARPTPETVAREAPPDPHMHLHAFVFNEAWIPDPTHPDGGKWRSVDDWGIKNHASKGEREAIVMGEFARRLEARGYKLDYHTDRKGRVSFELAGSTIEERRLHSSNARRAAAIARRFEQDMARPPTADELRNLMRETRLPKDKAQEFEPDHDRWIEAAKRAGVKLTPIRPGDPQPLAPLKDREQELRERLYEPEGLAREDATFTRESVRPAVSRCAVGLGFTQTELDAFANRLIEHELVTVRAGLEPSRFDYFTTPRVVEQELYIAATAETKAAAHSPTPSPAAVERAIAAQAVELDDEQRSAIELATSGKAWVVIEGEAGTGKTTLLKAVRDAVRDDAETGKPTADQIAVLCTSARTAIETGTKLDADYKSSVERFVGAVDRGQFTPTERTVLILDEAPMIDTPRMAKLLEAAGPARIILVGDPQQLQAIGAAGWYADLAERFEKATLTNVHRQKDQRDVEALKDIRRGDPDKALRSFAERGRLHIDDTRVERIGRVVKDYKAHRDAGRSPDEVRVVVQTSNTDVDQVNRLLQDDRLRRAELSGEGIEVRATDEDRTWRLYEGDSVVFLKPYRHDGQEPIANGTTGRLVDLDDDRQVAHVEANNGERYEVRLATEDHTQTLGLSYAMHAAKFQGGEVAVVQTIPGRQSSRESAYSANSRGVEEIHVYIDHETHGADPVQTLTEAWAEADPKRSAMARMGEREPKPMPTAPVQTKRPEAAHQQERPEQGQESQQLESEPPAVDLEPVVLEAEPELFPVPQIDEGEIDWELGSETPEAQSADKTLEELIAGMDEDRSLDELVAGMAEADRSLEELIADMDRDDGFGLERE